MGLKARFREAGRVLSKANETKLAQAADHMATAHGHVQDVIASVGGEPGDGIAEAERSHGQLRQVLSDAARAQLCDPTAYYCDCWIQDVYDSYVIVNMNGDLFSLPWSLNADSTVTFGQPTPCMVTYAPLTDATGDDDDDGDDGVLAPAGVPTAESQRITADAAHTLIERSTLTEAVTKTDGGKKFTASDYAYVPDAMKPSTWKLRLTATPGAGPDAATVGAAAAALSAGGFRGQKVSIPAADLAAVKAKVRTAWTKANPDKDADEMPESIKEAGLATITSELVPLIESAVQDDGTAQLKVITPGWGSTGYYPVEVLKRDAAAAFPAGTHMYLDHPTLSESIERPERSIKDLAATLLEDAHWVDTGPDGPGVYAKAQVVEGYRDVLNAVAPNTGVSIHANGSLDESGEAEGKRGPIIRRIAAATESQNSIDFVTRPGAGGRMVELFEAARAPQKGQPVMADDTKLTEAQTRIARLEEALILRDARDFLRAELAHVELPDMTRRRIAESLAANPPAKDGALDRVALKLMLDDAVKSETTYLVEVAGYGRVAGMGAPSDPAASDPAKVEASLTEAFADLGLSKDAAILAARGR